MHFYCHNSDAEYHTCVSTPLIKSAFTYRVLRFIPRLPANSELRHRLIFPTNNYAYISCNLSFLTPQAFRAMSSNACLMFMAFFADVS